MVRRLLKKLGIKPPYDPGIPLLGIYPEETKIEKDTCIPLFISALFTIARTWKQPRCPSVDEWIKKLWYIYTMDYYSRIKKNTFEPVLMRWVKLEPIIQSEVSQKEKHQYSILMHEVKIVSNSLRPHGLYGILQARILEWVAFPFSRGSSQPRDQTQVSRIAGRFFTCLATREA